MSDIAALLDEVASAGGGFALSGDRVRVRAPHPLPAALMQRLSAAKPAVVKALKARPVCCECKLAILEPAVAWWGGEPVHASCGLKAWERQLRIEGLGTRVVGESAAPRDGGSVRESGRASTCVR